MTKIRGLFKWGIFLSSYAPLFLILAYKHRDIRFSIPSVLPLIGGKITAFFSGLWIVLTIGSLIMLGLVFYERTSREPEPMNIEKARSRNDLITNYVLVYIFPFVVLDFSKFANWVAFIVFLITIGIIQVRSNHLYVNPVLGILGYNIYEAYTEERRMTLLIKGRIDESPIHVSTVELSHGVYIAI